MMFLLCYCVINIWLNTVHEHPPAAAGDIGYITSIRTLRRSDGPEPLVQMRMTCQDKIDAGFGQARQRIRISPGRPMTAEINAWHVIADEFPFGVTGPGISDNQLKLDFVFQPFGDIIGAKLVHRPIIETKAVRLPLRYQQFFVITTIALVISLGDIDRHTFGQPF